MRRSDVPTRIAAIRTFRDHYLNYYITVRERTQVQAAKKENVNGTQALQLTPF
jgi:hypothetical protein